MTIPYRWRLLIYLVLLGAILLIWGIGLLLTENCFEALKNRVFKGDLIGDRPIIQGNSYIGTNMPYIPEFQVLGMELDECFYKIIEGESNFNPTICNQKYGCGSGIGLGQLTAVAIKDCEKGLEKKLNPYNSAENLECSLWLYEKYGTKPWGCPECDWGSYNYFIDYCY